MNKTIYVDVDSTIWPAELEYTRSEMRLHGTDDLVKNWYDVPELKAKYGEDYREIFWDALNPKKVLDRVMYPGVENAVLTLRYELGFNIHFITHSPFPEQMEPAMREWFDFVLGDVPGFVPDLTVYDESNCKATTMASDPTAWGIIEDKPSTAHAAIQRGYRVYLKRHVWNREYLKDNTQVQGFDEWKYIPGMVAKDLTVEANRVKMGV